MKPTTVSLTTPSSACIIPCLIPAVMHKSLGWDATSFLCYFGIFFFFSSAGVQWSLMSSKGQILQSGFSGKWIIFWPSKNHNYRKVNLFISGTKDSRSCKAEQQMQLTKLSVALLRWKMDFTIKNQLDATPHFNEAKILYFLIIIHWAPPALTIHLVLSTMLNHLFKGNFSPW